MKLKPVVATLCVLGLATASSAFAGANMNSLQSLQMQVNKLQQQVNAMGSGSSAGGMASMVTRGYPAFNGMLSRMGGGYGVNLQNTFLNAINSGDLAVGKLAVGGRVKVIADYDALDYSGAARNQNDSQLQLNDVDLYAAARINKYTSTFVDVDSSSNGSSVSVDQGFVMFNTMGANQVFSLMGKTRVPFGSMNTYSTIYSPLTWLVKQAYTPQAEFGYNGHGVMLVGSLFDGAGKAASGNTGTLDGLDSSKLNNFVLSASYKFKVKDLSGMVGGSYLNAVSNISSASLADSAAAIGTFSDSNNAVYLTHNGEANPAADVYFNGTFGPVGMMAEYAQTLNDVDVNANMTPSNPTTSNHKARFWDVELAYMFPVMGMSSKAYTSYSHASLSDNLSEHRWILGYGVKPWKAVSMALEYSYDKLKVGANAPTNFAGAANKEIKSNSIGFVTTVYF